MALLVDVIHRKSEFGQLFAPVPVENNGIFISESDLLFGAGVLHGADQNFIFQIDVLGVGPIGKGPVIETDSPLITHHADAMFKTWYHIV